VIEESTNKNESDKGLYSGVKPEFQFPLSADRQAKS